MQNAVRDKPAKLEEFILLTVRCGSFWNILGTGIFRYFGTGRGEFSIFCTGIPALALLITYNVNYVIQTILQL